MASVPHRVTRATAAATSESRRAISSALSCLRFRSSTLLTAPIAEAPQIAYPVATSNGCSPGRPIFRPSHCVPKNVAATTPRIITTVAQPSPSTSPMLSLRPSRTTPARISRFPANVSPGCAGPRTRVRSPGTWAATMPSTTAAVSMGMPGSSACTASAHTTPTTASARPGALRRTAATAEARRPDVGGPGGRGAASGERSR